MRIITFIKNLFAAGLERKIVFVSDDDTVSLQETEDGNTKVIVNKKEPRPFFDVDGIDPNLEKISIWSMGTSWGLTIFVKRDKSKIFIVNDNRSGKLTIKKTRFNKEFDVEENLDFTVGNSFEVRSVLGKKEDVRVPIY